ncbi:hypothetical protein O3P69_003510 [Scylla paramamosain]|uniref:polynucleotide adenylyltransferase n=1 Tax=Scylla paramamosain TaxID=85552 RepID=A0AAW0UJV1_SCYPA
MSAPVNNTSNLQGEDLPMHRENQEERGAREESARMSRGTSCRLLAWMLVGAVLTAACVGLPLAWTVALEWRTLREAVQAWREEGPHATRLGRLRQGLAAAWWLGPLRPRPALDPLQECGIPADDDWQEVFGMMTKTRQALRCLEEQTAKADEEQEAFSRTLLVALCSLASTVALLVLLGLLCPCRGRRRAQHVHEPSVTLAEQDGKRDTHEPKVTPPRGGQFTQGEGEGMKQRAVQDEDPASLAQHVQEPPVALPQQDARQNTDGPTAYSPIDVQLTHEEGDDKDKKKKLKKKNENKENRAIEDADGKEDTAVDAEQASLDDTATREVEEKGKLAAAECEDEAQDKSTIEEDSKKIMEESKEGDTSVEEDKQKIETEEREHEAALDSRAAPDRKAPGVATLHAEAKAVQERVAIPPALPTTPQEPARGAGQQEDRPRAPWCSLSARYDATLAGLHQEVEDFQRWVSGSEGEGVRRMAPVKAVRRVVKSLWPRARVEVTGSLATGLYLPDSDVDLTVLDQWQAPPLHQLRDALVRRGVAAAASTTVLDRATVPLVKFVHAPTGLHVDVSFGNVAAVRTCAISVRRGGRYLSKEEVPTVMPGGHRRSMLAIEDPLTPGNDVTRASFRAAQVTQAFRDAFQATREFEPVLPLVFGLVLPKTRLGLGSAGCGGGGDGEGLVLTYCSWRCAF